MNTEPHLVSVAMPVYNGRDTISLAIQSIRRQTYTSWELLVIDDGSTDNTKDIAQHHAEGDGRIRVFSDGRNLGISYRLNQAIAVSRGSLFARMDGDDVAYPERLERQAAYLLAHPELDLVGAGAIVFGDDGVAIGKRFAPERHDEICARPYAGFPITHPTFMGRMEFFRRYGYAIGSILGEDRDSFSATFPNGLTLNRGDALDDLDFLMRTHRGSRLGNMPEILLGYREGNLRIKKQAKLRYRVMRTLYYNLQDDDACGRFLWYASVQLTKFLCDCFAISTGLRYRILRHRARPVAGDEIDRWNAIWCRLAR